jgi:hypothetical protein
MSSDADSIVRNDGGTGPFSAEVEVFSLLDESSPQPTSNATSNSATCELRIALLIVALLS